MYYGSISSCSACAAGTYSTGGAASCTNCPAGYTTWEGAVSLNSCYIDVPGGKYIETANSATQSSCPAGTYSNNHRVAYGSISGCTTCPENTYSGEGASSCSSCPYGYVSSAGSTAINQCFIWVPGGKYLATPYSSVLTQCPAGLYSGSGRVYAGNTTSCISCGNGYVPTPEQNGCQKDQCTPQEMCGQYASYGNVGEYFEYSDPSGFRAPLPNGWAFVGADGYCYQFSGWLTSLGEWTSGYNVHDSDYLEANLKHTSSKYYHAKYTKKDPSSNCK